MSSSLNAGNNIGVHSVADDNGISRIAASVLKAWRIISGLGLPM